MSGGTNGPLIYDGTAYQFDVKTLLQLRNKLMIRLGFAAQLAVSPPGMDILLNEFLIDAQEQMYKRFSPLRNQIWWTINVTQGNRHYDIPAISSGSLSDVTIASASPDTLTRISGSWITDGFTPGQVITISGSSNNAGATFVIATVSALVITTTTNTILTAESSGTTMVLSTMGWKSLDMRRISEQWVNDGSTWNKMREGINPNRFNETGQAYPQDYEWTDHLEIWPEPDKTYTIFVKGHFGLFPFEADADVTTIDWNLIYLHGLANAKTHYGQKDAGTYFRQLEVFLRKLNKETFGNKRYIPNPDPPVRILSKPEATWR